MTVVVFFYFLFFIISASPSAAINPKIPATCITRNTIHICVIKIEMSIKGLSNVPFCLALLNDLY